MSSQPQTPGHSRHSTIDFQTHSPGSSPQDRRQSRSSLQDPGTPLRQSFTQGDGLDIFSSGGMAGGGGGMANLADELADAFSDGEDDDYYDDNTGAPDVSFDIAERQAPGVEGQRDSGVDVGTSPKQAPAHSKNMSLTLPSPSTRHRRAGSEYDGSEYGSESDLDSPGMPPSLVAKIDAVESLARRGTESNGSQSDGVFTRVTDGLRDLGSQSGVEGGATRLITSHSALTTHLTHQTRQVHSLAFPLLSPLVAPPEPDAIDELLPLLVSLSEQMPRPSTAALNSLSALHTLTSDLVQTLNYLSDTLHMSKQTSITAARRLKSAKELVAELRQEEDLREEGERWIARGNWGERLKNRECAHTCGEIVGGFEEVCNDWRARLLAQEEVAQAS